MAVQIQEEAFRAFLAAHGLSRGCGRAHALRSTRACHVVSTFCARRPISSATLPATATHTRRRIQPVKTILRQNEPSKRSYAKAHKTKTPPQDIAVLGGGITGLTTTWYLSRFCPDSKITLYEASGRLGGWIETETRHVTHPDGRQGRVLFERAARTIKTQKRLAKYDDLVLYDMVTALKLKPKLLYTTKMDRLRRFIYYPDHLVDVTGPDARSFPQLFASGLQQLIDVFREPLFAGAIPSGLSFFNKRMELDAQAESRRVAAMRERNPQRDRKSGRKPAQDISVGEYFTAKFGGRRELVDNILSALVHGVYGADVWKLSMMSSIFRPSFVRDRNGAPINGKLWMPVEDWDLVRDLGRDPEFRRTAEQAQGAEYLSFHEGLVALTDALAADLEQKENVSVQLNTPVSKIEYNQDLETVTVTSVAGDEAVFGKVVSTLTAAQLCGITDKVPALKKQKSTSIMLVNLWYPNAELNKGADGFGYLVPSSVAAEHNPQAVLGVLFDSDREAAFAANHQVDSDGEENNISSSMDPDNLGGTKLTVMMGGHLWEDLPSELWPGPEEAVAMAKSAVAHQLGNPAFETEHAEGSAKLCSDCIPQHRVGHCADMAEAHAQLMENFGGKLAVAGGSFQLPGVLTNMRAARDVASHVAKRIGHWEEENKVEMLKAMVRLQDPSFGDDGNVLDVPWSVGETGLKRFTVEGPERAWWAQIPKTEMPFRFGNKVSWPKDAKEAQGKGTED